MEIGIPGVGVAGISLPRFLFRFRRGRNNIDGGDIMSPSASFLKEKKSRGERITMLTGYDCPTAQWLEAAGIDVVLVGDSVGRNVLGYADEKEVTMDDMVHHIKAVRRGLKSSYLLGDMPYETCETPEDALANARRFIECAADGVKLEGMKPEVIKRLTQEGIEVCAHLGLNPQIHKKVTLQGKTAASAVALIEDSLALEAAGAVMMIYELMPEEVARVASQRLSIPTIGIGAGRHTDGQVLVFHDLMGINTMDFRHSRKYEDLNARVLEALKKFAADVAVGRFPGEENTRHLSEKEKTEFETWARKNA